MASQVPPQKNAASGFTFEVELTSQANPLTFQTNPTLAAGDVKVSVDQGAFNNITTLPTVEPSGGTKVKVVLSQSEINGDNIGVIFHDAAGDEWCDLGINIQTVERRIDDLAFPTTPGRSLDVTATGAAGIDWGNVENPTTILGLSGTTIKDVTDVETAIAALNNLSEAEVLSAMATVLTATVADSVPADGSRPSIASGILAILRFLTERAVAGTTVTVNKEDGTTPSMTFTINNAVAPTSITRAT